MTLPRIPPPVEWIARTLEDAGFETWAVGGAVRDHLLSVPSEDWDLATRARPADVQRLFRRTVPVGVDHGTVGVLARGGTLYEVTTFRRDVEPLGRRAIVEFAETLDEDLARRDFTINAVALHPLRGEVHDPFDGQGDLARRVLRTVGRPEDRFREDYLRILRALRFAGTLGLRIETATWQALTAAVPKMGLLSAERIREEMEKILGGESPPSKSLALYAASGVLAFLYPEIEALRGVPRGDRGEWFGHTLRVVDGLSPRRPVLRWAALLHGLGEGGPTEGADQDAVADRGDRALRRSAALLERLRSSHARIRDVAGLTRSAAYPPAQDASDAALRRWLSSTGRGALPGLLRIWAAAARSDEPFGGPWTTGRLAVTARRLRGLARSGVALGVEELAFSGRDLIRMGYKPGPRFGELLEHLLDRALDDPSVNEPRRLEAEAERWMADREPG
jgi:tRNA nucleotidyltransferase/poly(A) polymerase